MSVEIPQGEKIPAGWQPGAIVDGVRKWFAKRSTETGWQQLVRTGIENEYALYLGANASSPTTTGTLEEVLAEADRLTKK